MDYLTFSTVGVETLQPDDGKAGDIFSRLGYRFADAVADLVDNSIDAGADAVHVRFVRSEHGIQRVLIADNGSGMDAAELREAMRFGSRSKKAASELGKYGIGLKSASLSQAEMVTVLTRQGKQVMGRRWTLPNVKNNWTCELLEDTEVQKAFGVPYGEFTLSRSGTIVIWEHLEHLRALPSNLDKVIEKTIKELRVELGIRFHRFIAQERLQIGIDQQYGMQKPSGATVYVAQLDPFGYEVSGRQGYPTDLEFTIGGVAVMARCHIWPPKSRSPGYRLGGGKVALRQGFYFYRNDRVIQAGGWNTLRADDSEPHLSLARVEIDLPPALDSVFKLDVTKSRLDPGPEFTRAIQTAEVDGVSFDKYLVAAQAAYRKQKTKDGARFPAVPGPGLPARAQQAIARILHEPGTERPARINFKWKRLDADEVFRLDSKDRSLLLNTRFRDSLREGKSNDAPVLKVVLMFLLQEEFGKAFVTSRTQEWLQMVNQSLLASLKE